MSDELTRLEELATAATPGPWMWRGNTKAKMVALMAKRGWGETVMAFARWGMQSAQPWFNTGGILRDLSEAGVQYEVDYRKDFIDINHPDAKYIAAMSPDVALSLIQRLRTAEAELEAAEEQGRREAARELRAYAKSRERVAEVLAGAGSFAPMDLIRIGTIEHCAEIIERKLDPSPSEGQDAS